MTSRLHELQFYASLQKLEAKDHSATFYLINTSVNRNRWAVTEKALKEALPTLLKANLGIGPDYKFDAHYNDGLNVGKFVTFTQPDESYALGTAKVTDGKVWDMMQSSVLGPVSVVLHSYRESCGKCGVVFSGEENPQEHNCIKKEKAHVQIESFVFHRVDFVDIPAYPQAGLLELAAKSALREVPLEVLASFYVSQEHPTSGVYHKIKNKEEKSLTEIENQKIADLEAANAKLSKDLEAAAKKASDNEAETKTLKAHLDKISKEQHDALVNETYEARLKAGLAGKPEDEKTLLTAQSNQTLTILKNDAVRTAALLNTVDSSPKTKYAKSSGTDLDGAIKEMRANLGFPAEEAK
ncbi:MAG: hypothetical protein IAX22_07780 [Candidatus Bathyarchaeota archaeon]|nr:hypothetical protein [Candidatus Bathyarchaeota archaeon]